MLVGNSVDKFMMDENEAQRRELMKYKKKSRGKGLSFRADTVLDKFSKVAFVTHRVRAKEQVMEHMTTYCCLHHL